ncbi:zf-HC2 domain-containing protein [Actinoallomurus spadix]|uniref:Zf-HC2 domain-containing protein n=1 Tax=Actinoallomurus spadix TaxID=79912 RepID=A0ABN0XKX9_9ACTN|nr:zf-HC2 domain-containing protein [Actinoallomurus spadix]MCO5985063.1 zf-HC2 domain-containing protein [Actinoallomurus spadix]
MTTHARCADLRALLGVYVLGAIDPAERSQVDEHLARCRRCRDELAGLAGLPALLGRVTEEQITQVGAPPPELLEPVLARAAAEHRARSRGNRRWLVVAAAVALVTGGAGVAGGFSLGADRTVAGPAATPSPGPTTPGLTTPGPAVGAATTVQATDAATGISARITMRAEEWGTAFTVRLTGAPSETLCHLVAVARDGRRDIAGGWAVKYERSAEFAGSSMIPKDRITAVEVRTVDGRRLLSVRV